MATQTQTDDLLQEDVGNIMLMEHVNVQIDDQSIATLFYLVGLGFTRDPHMMVGLENMWVNLGEQQFHLPTNEKVNVLRGHIGVVTPSLDALAQRLESVAPRLKGTKFAWSRRQDYIEATCPWGNHFRIYEPSERFGNIVTGMPYVEFTVPVGTAEGIVRFYDQAIGCHGDGRRKPEGKAAVVSIGQYQQPDLPRDGECPALRRPPHRRLRGELLAPLPVALGARPDHGGAAQPSVPLRRHRRPGHGREAVRDRARGAGHEARCCSAATWSTARVGQFLEPRRMNGQTILGAVG